MPGFNIGGSGSPNLQVDGKAEVRRGYRWIFEIDVPQRSWVYLQSANRPKMTLGTPEQHHNQEKIWHVGKTTWNDITLTFYDVETPIDASKAIYDWLLTSTYDIPNANAFHPRTYKKDATLSMLDHMGSPNEQWMIYHAWPHDVDWGALDYASEEIAKVVTILKYDRAVKTA